MSGGESGIRKNVKRLAAGAVGLGIAFAGNELMKPNRPEVDQTVIVDSAMDRGDTAEDSTDREASLPTRTEVPASLTEKINGADPVLEAILDKGYKDFTIATDGTTLQIYNEDGTNVLNLWPLGDKWKITQSPDSRTPEWSRMSGIDLAEPIVSTGEEIQQTIDAYQQLNEWRTSWMHVDTNSGLFSTIGTDQLPTTQEGRDEIQAQQEDELAKLEDIILKSDNPLIEHPAEEAN